MVSDHWPADRNASRWATFERILVEMLTRSVNEVYPRLGLFVVNSKAGFA
jgi:hypothetical protein